MKYAKLGDTGLVVSRLSLGSMTFGSGQGALGGIWKTPQKEADAIVGRTLDAMTAPSPCYPNWFNEKTADAQTREALGA